MVSQIKRTTNTSMFKFLFLIVCYFIIIFLIEKVEISIADETSTPYATVQSILNHTHKNSTNPDIYHNVYVFNKIYSIFKTFGLYLFGFGVILNVVVDIIVDKTKWRKVIIVLGVVKILTLAPITGIMTLIYGIRINNYEIESESINQNIVPNDNNDDGYNYNNISNRKKYHYSSFPVALSSVFWAIFISLVSFFIFFQSPVIGILGFFGAIYELLFYPNKRACFKRQCRRIKNNMEFPEVKNIMRKFKVINCGFIKNNEYVLQYKIQFGRQYEEVQVSFFNGIVIEKDIGYRRITQTTTYN